MSRFAAFFRWLGTPIRATRALFPFTQEGRQTLIYLMCAFSAPILTLVVLHILNVAEAHGQWGIYAQTARVVSYSLLIVCSAYAMFVAFRTLVLGGKEGLLNLTSKESQPDPVRAAKAVEEKVVEAAAGAVEKVEAASAAPPAPDAGLPESLR